jgi:hypothetical protein
MDTSVFLSPEAGAKTIFKPEVLVGSEIRKSRPPAFVAVGAEQPNGGQKADQSDRRRQPIA